MCTSAVPDDGFIQHVFLHWYQQLLSPLFLVSFHTSLLSNVKVRSHERNQRFFRSEVPDGPDFDL